LIVSNHERVPWILTVPAETAELKIERTSLPSLGQFLELFGAPPIWAGLSLFAIQLPTIQKTGESVSACIAVVVAVGTPVAALGKSVNTQCPKSRPAVVGPMNMSTINPWILHGSAAITE